MPRAILTSIVEPPSGTVLFECTREDLYIALYSKGFSPVRVETDGRLIYVVYIRADIDDTLKQIQDPRVEFIVDYRQTMLGREAWRNYLQLLADYKIHRQ